MTGFSFPYIDYDYPNKNDKSYKLIMVLQVIDVDPVTDDEVVTKVTEKRVDCQYVGILDGRGS